MKIIELQMLQTLYEQDYCAWVEQIAELLRCLRRATPTHQWDTLDLEHLIEEVVDLGKSQQRALQSALRLVLSHLLKWKYQSERCSHSWQVSYVTS